MIILRLQEHRNEQGEIDAFRYIERTDNDPYMLYGVSTIDGGYIWTLVLADEPHRLSWWEKQSPKYMPLVIKGGVHELPGLKIVSFGQVGGGKLPIDGVKSIVVSHIEKVANLRDKGYQDDGLKMDYGTTC